MTAYGLYPQFTDRDGYLAWRRVWKATYRDLSVQIRDAKWEHADKQKVGDASYAKKLAYWRAMGRKMMTLLGEAKQRRDRIIAMHAEIADQGFPLDLGDCKNVDFHFNKGHVEFPFLPMWTIRAKGRSYYVREVESDVAWTTRERATGSTKGVLRFSRCLIAIDEHGVAKISGETKNSLTAQPQ